MCRDTLGAAGGTGSRHLVCCPLRTESAELLGLIPVLQELGQSQLCLGLRSAGERDDLGREKSELEQEIVALRKLKGRV